MKKYLELFKGSFDDSIIEKMKPENYPYVAYSIAEDRIVYGEIPSAVEGPANNEIWYTSTDGSVVNPNNTSAFGANFVSNTYENGKGIITFDGDVTSIGDGVFYNCTGLTSVTIPNSATSIGTYAFYLCTGLTSVTFGSGVTSIGERAFHGCSGLTSVTLGSGVTSIGNSAFQGCSGLTSVTFGSGVTSIGNSAFQGCSGLTSITFGSGVTSIEERAFYYCSGLTSVTFGSGVTNIGERAFYYCSGLTSVIYNGTQEQWGTITKGHSWCYDAPVTYVQCIDGQADLY